MEGAHSERDPRALQLLPLTEIQHFLGMPSKTAPETRHPSDKTEEGKALLHAEQNASASNELSEPPGPCSTSALSQTSGKTPAPLCWRTSPKISSDGFRVCEDAQGSIPCQQRRHAGSSDAPIGPPHLRLLEVQLDPQGTGGLAVVLGDGVQKVPDAKVAASIRWVCHDDVLAVLRHHHVGFYKVDDAAPQRILQPCSAIGRVAKDLLGVG
eukprot:scaffold803_cov310-Pinguiococcus_pyrenoidosus.AAC.217